MRFRPAVAFFFLAGFASAEPVAPRFSGTPLLRVWRTEDYGAALNNWRVIAHPNGLVYVANNDGVLEFDGESWRFIPLPRGGSARSLALDARGLIWVGGHDDLCRLEADEHGGLRAVSVLAQLPAGERTVGTVSRAVATRDGVYFRGQRRLILFRAAGGVQSWATADTPGMLWRQGDTLYADLDALVQVTPAGFTPVALGSDGAETAAKTFLRVFAAAPSVSAGNLLLTSRGPVLWAGPGEPLRTLSAEADAAFRGDLASAGAFLPDGRLAIGTERSGLYLLGPDGRVLQHLDRAQGLPGNRINDLAVDADGGLWLAMQEGIAHLAVSAPFARHGEPQGLTGTARHFASFRGQLYLAHSEGLSRRDPATGRFVSIEGFQVGSNRPLPVGDRLVAATRGLREITPDDKSRAWTAELIGPIAAAGRTPGWILAGSSAGLWLIAPSPDEGVRGWQTLGRVAAINTGIDEILDSGDGDVWAVTRAGRIWRVDFRAGLRLEAPATEFGPEQGLPDATRRDRVQVMQLGGEVFAVAAGWVRRYDPGTRRFEPETRLGGGATAVGAAAGGGCWLQPAAQPERMVRVRAGANGRWPASGISIAPLRALPLDSAFEESATHTLWLAGEGALMSVDLAWQPPAAVPLRVLVRRVTTGEGELVFGGASDPPTPGHPPALTPAQNALRFDFAAPVFSADYLGRGQTVYRTRLDGLEDKWTAWTTDAHREFTNLPYRALAFHVQARALDGRVSAEATWAFVRPPPWWFSRWAWAGYAAAGALGVAGLVRLRTRALRQHAARLEGIVVTRTAELALQNAELARLHRLELDEKTAARLAEEKARLELLRYQLNPHFLANAFTTLRSLVFSRPESAGEMLGQLAEFCRFALTRTDDTGGTVADEAMLIETYLAMEKTRWRENLAVTIAVEPAVAGRRLPPFLLQPLVENAIKYGGQTSPGRLEVRVKIAAEGAAAGALFIEVANTGTWVEPGGPGHGDSTGLGMENLRQRLRRYYPDAHSLHLRYDSGWVRVTLHLHQPAREPFAPTHPAH